jgi:hypothetical protein
LFLAAANTLKCLRCCFGPQLSVAAVEDDPSRNDAAKKIEK